MPQITNTDVNAFLVGTPNPTQQTNIRSRIGSQAALVSGTNLKTVNGNSLLGSGNITITGSGGDGQYLTTSSVSITGGADKIPQFDSSGNLQTGPYTSVDAQFSSAGNVHIPDRQGLRWIKRDGTISNAAIYHWQSHDSYGGELIVNSPWRIALCAYGPLQIGVNDSGRNPMYLHITSGAATQNDTMRQSKAISLQTITYSGGTSTSNHIMMQATPLDTTGDNSVLQIYDKGEVYGANGGSSGYDIGKVTGNLISEIGNKGIWSRGTSPTFDILPNASNGIVVHTCSKYKTVQMAKVTISGANSLSFTDVASGMRGVIYVTQGTGSGTLSLPSGSVVPSSFALSTTPTLIDRLEWEFDGTNYYWQITNGLTVLPDTDATAFFTRASISDTTIKTAVSNLVTSLKNNSLWDKFYALYPFVGGNATAHSQNLKGNSASIYPITWSGGVTHDTNGVTGDGTSGIGQTGFNFALIANSQNSASGYVYSRTQTPNVGGFIFGAAGGTTATRFGVTTYSSTLLSATGPNSNTVQVLGVNYSNLKNHIALNRDSSNLSTIYYGSSFGTNSATSLAAEDCNISLLAQNFKDNSTITSGNYSNVNIAFAAFGAGLSSVEWSTFRGLIDAFQTTLNRANP